MTGYQYAIHARTGNARQGAVTDTALVQSIKQLDAALKCLKASGSAPFDAAALERAAGVGVVVSKRASCTAVERSLSRVGWQVTHEEIAATVASTLQEKRKSILDLR